MVLKFFLKNFLNLFFSLSIILGIYIAVGDRQDHNSNLYFTFISTSFFLYLTQLTLIYLKNTTSRNLNISFRSFLKPIPFTNLFVIPITGGFISFQLGIQNATLSEVVLLICAEVFILFLLFYNLQSSVKDDEAEGLLLDESFDLMKLFITFLISLYVIRIFIEDGSSRFSTILPFLLIIFFIAFTVVVQLNKKFLPSILISAIVTGIFGIVFLATSKLEIASHIEILFALSQTILFYILLSIYQHAHDHTINRRGILKYLLVFGVVHAVVVYLAY